MSTDIVAEPKQTYFLRLVQQLRLAAERLLVIGGLAVCLQVILIWCSRFHPVLELANHFSVHGLVLGTLLLCGLCLRRRRSSSLLVGLAVIYLAWLVQPWSLYLANAQTIPAAHSRSIKVLSWNILATNQAYAEVEAVVRAADADIVLLIETQPTFDKELSGITASYPLNLRHLQWGGSGISAFCRIPGAHLELLDLGVDRMLAIVVTIPGESATPAVKLVGIHTLSPNPPRRAIPRDLQLYNLANWAVEQTVPLCACGDLNTTPWTRSFQYLLDSGFRDSRTGVGNNASWPHWMGVCGIPIDHALTRGACSISHRQVLSSGSNSDHRPLSFTLHY
ncbi:MAG: endonuclease/exonuclease/phosphatase family protein [Pirellulaceae bacterium]